MAPGVAIHFLHIGRCGGSAIKRALAGVPDFVLHERGARLRDVPPGEKFFFVVRHPVERFVSGFNSRLRRQMQGRGEPWSDAETLAFHIFKTPNELGEALASDDRKLRTVAAAAMRGILHVREPMTYWLDPGELQARKGDVLAILRMARLDADFTRMRNTLGLGSGVALLDDLTDGRAPRAAAELSELATARISRHYRADIDLFNFCIQLRRELDHARPALPSK